MLHEPVDLFGLGFSLSPYQLIILVAFASLLIGYLLAVLVNRRGYAGGANHAALSKERVASNVAFMKGINYILSDKHDQAIEELRRAVSVDTDTIETYVALGNLFRARGEIERAIRIRQTIILRPGIDEKIRLETIFDLGLDYRRGGFYDRAIKTFYDVLASDSKHIEAHVQLVQLYEETRDWQKAFEIQSKLAKITGRKAANVLAHYQVEIGKELFDKGFLGQAKAAYKKALSLDEGCVDGYLHFGDLQLYEGKYKKAVATWRRIVEVAPDMAYLTFGRLALVAGHLKDMRPVEDYLVQCTMRKPSPLAHLALARLLAQRGENDRAILELTQALEIDPYLIEARKEIGLLLLSLGRTEEALASYRDLLGNLAGPDATFQCNRCGLESKQLIWRCPQCYSWDTMNLYRHYPLLFEHEGPVTKELVTVDAQKEFTAEGGR